jgi:glycosyltransferase involved in cell wall biosynthesis
MTYFSKQVLTKNSSPLVSICIPTFNGGKFLSEALASINQQTYLNLEIIVSDDNSNDNTLEILKRFKKNNRIPVYIYQHSPSGIGANWNNCIKHANGKYIKFLFQDDVLYEDCISKMIEISERDNQIGLVYCKRSFIENPIDKNHEKWLNKFTLLHSHWDNLRVNTGYIKGEEYLKDRNLLKVPYNKIGEPTAVLIRKTSLIKAGYFNEDLKQALDIEMWYKLMKYFKIGFVNEELVYFRLHNDQASANNQAKGVREIEKLEIFAFKNLMFKLHPNNQWKLFKKYSMVGFYFRKVKNLIISC